MKPKIVRAPARPTRDPLAKVFTELLNAAIDVQNTFVAETTAEKISLRQLFKAITKAQGVL